MSLWQPLPVGLQLAGLLAAALGFALALGLGRMAWQLPRALDGGLPAQPSAAHRRWRLALWAAGPALAAACLWRFGATPAAFAALVFSLMVLALAWIDAETGYLPDALTLPLLWLGLLVNLYHGYAALDDAVLGAVAGYGLLWLIDRAYFLVRRREGMGRGDFKLLAALGAWLGWYALPGIVLAASLAGLAYALLQWLRGRLQADAGIRFGPFLGLAGLLAMFRY